MNKISKQFPILLYLPLGFILYLAYFKFQWNCPNADFLGWDPGSRFQVSLFMADSFRNLNFIAPLGKLLDSPTWPSLRSIPESLAILIRGADSKISIYINLFLFLGTLLSFYSLVRREIIYFPVIALVVSWIGLGLVRIEPYFLYTFSGMLEIMGGLVFLWVVYGVKVWNRNKFILPIGTFLLLQTKYPYAIMFLFCLTFYLAVTYRYPFLFFLKIAVSKLSKDSKRNPILLFLVIPISLLALNYSGIIDLPGKTQSWVTYSIFPLILIESIRFISKYRILLVHISSDIYKMLIYVYLPSIIWLIIHPDRFTATSNTIQHVQGNQSPILYWRTLNEDIPYLFVVLILSLIVFIGGIWFPKLIRTEKGKEGYSWTLYLLFPLLTIIGLSMISPNQQERHIYHLYPSIVLGIGLLIHSTGKRLIHSISLPPLIGYLIPLLIYLIVSTLSIRKDWNICYAGSNEDIRNHPLKTKEIAEGYLEQTSILINDIDSFHVNRADSELMMSIVAYEKKVKLWINPRPDSLPLPNRFMNMEGKPLEKFDIFRVSFSCDASLFKNQIARFNNVNPDEENIEILSIPYTDIGCMEIYSPRFHGN